MSYLEDTDGIDVEITLGGQTIRPLHVEVERLEHEGEMESIMDQCGYTENRRTGDRNFDITLEGKVSDDHAGAFANATVDTEASLTCGVYSGPIVVRNIIVERQASEGASYVDSSGVQHFVYDFQAQLRQPQME